MEYFRDPKNQIYADIAFRLGKIIVQYEKLSCKEDKYEATLCIAVMQNLLLTSNEYYKSMQRSQQFTPLFNKAYDQSDWKLNTNSWVVNTYCEERTLINFINRMRNSIAHPTNIKENSPTPSTGFITIKDGTNRVNKFRFIDSPDTNNYNEPKKFNKQEIESYIKRNQKTLPKDISYLIKNVNGQEKYYLSKDNKEFIRISKIDLTIYELLSFTKNLSNFLAQPIQKNWDGVTIKDLLAA